MYEKLIVASHLDTFLNAMVNQRCLDYSELLCEYMFANFEQQ